MTFKLKLVPRAAIAAKVSPRLTATVAEGTGIDVATSGGISTVGLDFASLGALSSIALSDRDNVFVATYNSDTLGYGKASIETLLGITDLAIKAPVRAATTANITLSGAQTIDGVAVVAGDRVLVKDQTTGANNGIYVVATGSWSRATDFDGSDDVVSGTQVYVTSGTVSGDTQWQLSNDNPITLGSTSLAFSTVLIRVPSLSTDNALARYDGVTGNLQNSGVLIDDSNNVTGAISLTTPLLIGGTGAASTLTLESTSGAGATDKVIVKTGAQVTTAYWETPPSTNTYTPASGSVVGQYVVDVGNAKNVRAVAGEFDIPGIGPLPPAGQMYLMANYADSTAGNISNLYAVAWNSGTRYTAAVTGIGIAPTGSSSTNTFGGQFSAIAAGNAGGILQGANIEADWSTGSVTGIALTLKLGDSAGGTTLNPGNSYINMLADTGKGPVWGLRFQANSVNPMATTGAMIGIDGANLSAAYGIDLNAGAFSTAAYRSPGFSVNGSGTVNALSYKLQTQDVITLSGNDILLADPTGRAAIKLGNVTDPVNYYFNTTHSFGSRNTLATFATIDVNGVESAAYVRAAATSGLYLGAVQALYQTGFYHQINDKLGNVRLRLGNPTDDNTNYLIGTTFQVESSVGTAFAKASAAGIGPTSSAARTRTMFITTSTALTADRTFTILAGDRNAILSMAIGDVSFNGAASLPAIAQGDLWYGSASGVISALAKDTNATRYLANSGTSNNPAWAQINLANGVSGTLAENNGGTGQSTYTTGDLIQATATNSLGKLAAVATGNALISGGVGTASSWGKIGLTTHISGTLGAANGGTGVANNAASTITISGNFGTTFTVTGTTSVTLPTSGTLATLAGSEALTNKSYNGLTITSSTGTLTVTNGKTLSVSNTLTFTGTDSSSVAFGTGGTVDYLGTNQTISGQKTFTNASGGIIAVGGSTSISPIAVNSGDAAGATAISLGRTGIDFKLAIAGATNDFMTGTAAGDTVFLTYNNFLLGTAAGTAAFKMDSSANFTLRPGLAIPAGGTQDAGLNMSSTAHFGVYFGSGAPSLSAAKGSLYLRSDGTGTGDRAYINTNGTTGWTALTTAA